MKCAQPVFLIIILALLLWSCSGQYKHSVQLDPLEPLRVAILPFSQLDGDGKLVPIDENLYQAANQTVAPESFFDPPAAKVRKMVAQQLRKSAFEIVPLGFITNQLVHHEFVKGTGYDHTKIESAKIQKLAELLGADALLFGKITEFDQDYYGIQSLTRFGLTLRLLRGEDAKVIFHSEATDSVSQGITKGPTGYTSLVVEPLRALSNDTVLELAEEVVEKSLRPLFRKEQKGYAESAPPVIFGAAENSEQGRIDAARGLTVLAIGSPEGQASFSLGEEIRDIPLYENEPRHYVGWYFPLPGEHFYDLPLVITMTDKFGRSTQQRVGKFLFTLLPSEKRLR